MRGATARREFDEHPDPRQARPGLRDRTVGQRRDGAKPKEACEHLTVAGDRYVMNSFCKNHDCEANSAVLLYSPEKKVVYGAVYEKGKSTLLGDPPATVAGELAKLWKAEWRTPAK